MKAPLQKHPLNGAGLVHETAGTLAKMKGHRMCAHLQSHSPPPLASSWERERDLARRRLRSYHRRKRRLRWLRLLRWIGSYCGRPNA